MLFCAKKYIKDTYLDGSQLWTSLENKIDFVFSHPNGWEGTEQTQMRRATVLAGLVPDTPEGHARISFVTEGEASLHFAIQNSVLGDAMEVRWLLSPIVVAHSLFRKAKGSSSLTLEEERLTLAPTDAMTKRESRPLKRFHLLNVRTSRRLILAKSFEHIARPLPRLGLCQCQCTRFLAEPSCQIQV